MEHTSLSLYVVEGFAAVYRHHRLTEKLIVQGCMRERERVAEFEKRC